MLLALTGLVARPAIGNRTPFFTRGEPREALVVQTVFRGDGFILPLRNGNELPSKPPLFHWLGALAGLVDGRLTEASIRLPSLVASLLTVAATAAAAWAWWGPLTGLLSAVVLATSFQWLASSVSARVDMVLAATVALALLLFARAVDQGRRIPALAFALMAAATLTKGPVGIILVLGIALPTLVLRGELRFLGWRELRLLGIWIAVPALWYVAAWIVGGEDFVAKQILKENVFRVLDAEAVGAGHVEPFWYYVPLLAAGLAPWSLYLPGLAVFAFASTSTGRRSRGRSGPPIQTVAGMPPAGSLEPTEPSGPLGPSETEPDDGFEAPAESAPQGGPERSSLFDRPTAFVLVWALVPFALFSVAGSKRAVYLLPAYPAWAMLVALAWTRLVRVGAPRIAGLVLAAGTTLASLLLALVSGVVLAGAAGLEMHEWIRGLVSNADVNNVAPMLEAARENVVVTLPCGAAVLATAWLILHSGLRGRWGRVVAATAVAMLALSTTVSTTLLPALASKRSTRSFLARVEREVPTDTPLSFYRAFDYGAVFYRGAPIPLRSSLADVPEIDGAWLLTWPAFLSDLAEDLDKEARKLDTGGEAAGAYEVEEVLASKDVDPSDRSTLVLVRIVRRIGDDHSDGN